jgi:hypothetical protein
MNIQNYRGEYGRPFQGGGGHFLCRSSMEKKFEVGILQGEKSSTDNMYFQMLNQTPKQLP